MTDRELLELAAKAAGIMLEWDGHPNEWQPMYYEGKTYHSFNPLTDDGDALRLAVKLRLVMTVGAYNVEARRWTGGDMEPMYCQVVAQDDDPYAAARRAIVRAAAEIGRGME